MSFQVKSRIWRWSFFKILVSILELKFGQYFVAFVWSRKLFYLVKPIKPWVFCAFDNVKVKNSSRFENRFNEGSQRFLNFKNNLICPFWDKPLFFRLWGWENLWEWRLWRPMSCSFFRFLALPFVWCPFSDFQSNPDPKRTVHKKKQNLRKSNLR